MPISSSSEVTETNAGWNGPRVMDLLPAGGGIVPPTASARGVWGESVVPLPSPSPAEAMASHFWDANYLKHGPMWGPERSQTATALIDLLGSECEHFGERIEIVEVGCGYGRDAVAFARAGFVVVGVDVALQGLLLANQACKATTVNLQDRVRFMQGTIRTVLATATAQFDGLACHRTLHLMSKERVLDFAKCAAELVKPGGFVSIGARSPRDFDPVAMEWVEGQEGRTAAYKDPSRRGHALTFLDEPFLRFVFEPSFAVSFSEGQERERADNDAFTKLIFMTGSRRS